MGAGAIGDQHKPDYKPVRVLDHGGGGDAEAHADIPGHRPRAIKQMADQ